MDTTFVEVLGVFLLAGVVRLWLGGAVRLWTIAPPQVHHPFRRTLPH